MAPYRTLRILFVCALSFLLATGAQSQPARQARLDSVMQAYAKLNWNATVLVGTPDSILYQHSIGYSNVSRQAPLTAQSLFHTASVGKMFTSTRILQLVAAGKISLTKPVREYLPHWQLANLDKITIHHLLTHTSGLASAWDHPNYDFKKTYTAAEVKKMMEEVPLAFQSPGERFSYSNIGYTLLGDIIAWMDNMPFEQSIEKYIFAPAGIDTRPYAQVSRFATPYYQTGINEFVPDEEMQLDRYKAGEGAGGWILTAQDLYRFLRAYLKGVYLDSNGRQLQLTANHSIDSTKNNFRYGLALLGGQFVQARTIYGHNGGGKGFSTDAFFDPHTGLIVVMASNQWASSYLITRNLFRVAYGEPIIYPGHLAAVKLIDGMRQLGAPWQISQPDSFFAQLKVPMLEQVFYQTYNLLDIARDYSKAAALMQAGVSKFPNARYLWYNGGIAAAKQNLREQARQYFTKARELATTEKDDILLQQITTQLSQLQ